MPVVTVATATHPAIGALLEAVAERIAVSLGLGDGDVIVTHVPTGATFVSGGTRHPESTWPIVTIHGSRRDGEKMDGARRASEAAVRAWCAQHDAECEGVWTQWLIPTPE